jgi:hypothetical protein
LKLVKSEEGEDKEDKVSACPGFGEMWNGTECVGIENINQCPPGKGFHIRGVKKCVDDPAAQKKAPKEKKAFHNALVNLNPVHMIISSAFIGMVIWGWTLFVYVKSSPEDAVMQGTVPFVWMWTHMGDKDYGWMAASTFSFFVVYALVDLPEVVGWMMIYSGSDSSFL